MTRPMAFRNHLLRSLEEADLAAIHPLLDPLPFGLGHVFEAPEAPIQRVCFPETGIISLVARSDTRRIEAGMIGREG